MFMVFITPNKLQLMIMDRSKKKIYNINFLPPVYHIYTIRFFHYLIIILYQISLCKDQFIRES